MADFYSLGVAYGYHDSSATLVKNGKVVASSTEDRFSRQKHDPGYPHNAIRFCLESGGISADRLDHVVFHEDPHEKFTRVLCSAFSGFPYTRREFVNSAKAWLGTKLWALSRLSAELKVKPEKIFYLNHHFSHALAGFLGSGFDRSCVMIMDAVGDWACASLYNAHWEDGRPQFKKIREINFPDSLCLAYSAFTEYLGFRPNDGECSVMALAAFGRPIHADAIRSIIRREEAGYSLDPSYFNFVKFYRGSVTKKFHDLFGAPRPFGAEIRFSSLEDVQDKDNQRYADIAASIQKVYEDTCLDLLRELADTGFSRNLCIAGGGAMNCVANAEFMKRSGFERFHIPPDPGDGGSSVGAALYVNALKGDPIRDPKVMRYDPYQGSRHDSSRGLDFVEQLSPRKYFRFEKQINAACRRHSWRKTAFSQDDDLLSFVADRIAAGKIVGFVSNRFEIGPRALGARSIFIRPDDIELAKRLSLTVKKRASYRPYALSILDTCAEEALELHADRQLYRWMQATAQVKPEFLARVRAAAHTDATTRPNICFAEENPRLHRLLEIVKERSGLGAVLNTSFNESGLPLVDSPVDALSMFARTSMDILVCDQVVIEKEGEAP